MTIEEIEISLRGAKPDLRPHPIYFRGVNFRSTLEARYVVFFDILGLRWMYEPKTWRLEPKWYKPDFYFPDLGAWGEVKPKTLNQEELIKADGLVWESNQGILLLVGLPKDGPYEFLRPGFREGFRPKTWCFFSKIRNELDVLVHSESQVLEASEKASRYKFS